MNKLLSPYDLGTFQTVETSRKVSVDELVRNALKDLKKRLVEAQIEALGIDINITTSKTRFNGERLYFQCPSCNKKVRNLYQTANDRIACRECLGLYYKKQRYKGMIEHLE